MSAAFRDLPGAVASMGGEDDAAVAQSPLHYGAPVNEQRLLEAGSAVVERGDRAIVTITGEDRLTWLDSITSQAVAGLAPGESAELLVLDPQGHIEHAAALVDDGATAWLIVDTDTVDRLVSWLARMVFRSRVEVARRADLFVVAAVGGASAGAALDGRSLVVWRDPWTGVVPGGHQYARIEHHPGSALEWIEAVVDPDTLSALAESVTDGSLSAAGLLAAEALRIAAWRPRAAAEVDEKSLPHELDWLRTAVHLNKGCYRGQETVAKVHNLGHPPRRIAFLHLDGSSGELPRAGSVVRSEGKDVGRVTSVARHHDLGPIALAVLRRSLSVDAVLTVDGDDGPIAASAEVIVPPDAGAAADLPRIPRLSSRR